MKWQVAVPEPDALGESLFWHPGEQRLYWVDIHGRRVRRFDPATGAGEQWELPQEPGCIAPAARGGLVLGLRDGIYRARSWGGALQCVVRFRHAAQFLRWRPDKRPEDCRYDQLEVTPAYELERVFGARAPDRPDHGS